MPGPAPEAGTAARPWRVGTRGSRLVRVQTDEVLGAVQRLHPEAVFEPVIIQTTGDADRTRALSAFSTTGVFVKEIERALLAGEIDLAVHSAKDLPTPDTPGLALAAFPARGAEADVLVCRAAHGLDGHGLPQLPAGSRVGTSSVRRRRQVLDWRADLVTVDLRGNVDTRLRKVAGGECDAAVLALAGLMRMGLVSEGGAAAGRPEPPERPQVIRLDGVPLLYAYPLPVDRFVPAPGQGALAVQVRAGDEAALALVGSLNDPETERAVRAERAFLLGMGSSCEVPIGALAQVSDGGRLSLDTYYAGAQPARSTWSGDAGDPEAVGRRAAQVVRASVPGAHEAP